MSVKVPPMSTATRKRCGSMVAVIIDARRELWWSTEPLRRGPDPSRVEDQVRKWLQRRRRRSRDGASLAIATAREGVRLDRSRRWIDDPVVGHVVVRIQLQLPSPVDRAGRWGNDLDHERRRAFDSAFADD